MKILKPSRNLASVRIRSSGTMPRLAAGSSSAVSADAEPSSTREKPAPRAGRTRLRLLVAAIGLSLSQALAIPIFDGIASIGIGVILALTAVCLAIRTKSLLIGEAAAPELIEDVKTRAAALEAVDAVNEVLSLHMGPHFVLLNLSVDFRDDLEAGDMERTIEILTRDIRKAHPDIKRVFVEAEAPKAGAES